MNIQKEILKIQLRKVVMKKKVEMAHSFTSLGATVNDSFYDLHIEITDEMIVEAFNDLGVDLSKVKGKKWYQFWLNDWNEKVENGIKLIPTP